MEIKIGTDPELFLKDGRGRFISAWGMIPGTKQEPLEVEKGAVQVDGNALEFNITPAKTAEEFDGNIRVVLTQLREMVDKVDKELKFEFTPVATFNKDYFQSIPNEAKILGCEPDFEWTGFMKEPPDITDQPIRTAAGHVHIGWTENEELAGTHFEDCKVVARHFYNRSSNRPFYYGTAEERKRLKFYGNNGAFRPKPYGLEIRFPSNLWVKNSDNRREMFNSVMTTMQQIPST